MKTPEQALAEIRRIVSKWLTDTTTDNAQTLQIIAAALIEPVEATAETVEELRATISRLSNENSVLARSLAEQTAKLDALRSRLEICTYPTKKEGVDVSFDGEHRIESGGIGQNGNNAEHYGVLATTQSVP